MRIGVRGCCGLGAARCPAPSFNSMKKKVKEDRKPTAGADFFPTLHVCKTKTSATRGPRGDGPRAPPRPPRRRGPPPGGPPRAPPPGPHEAAGAPPAGPRRPPPGRKKEKEEDKRDDVCLPRSSQHAHDLKCIRVSGNPSLRYIYMYIYIYVCMYVCRHLFYLSE